MRSTAKKIHQPAGRTKAAAPPHRRPPPPKEPPASVAGIGQSHLHAIWVDRTHKEIKDQLLWERKWGSLNDPKLYGGESVPSRYAVKPKPTRWANLSIINPPARSPVKEEACESPWETSSIARRRPDKDGPRAPVPQRATPPHHTADTIYHPLGKPTSASVAAGNAPWYAAEDELPTTPARGVYFGGPLSSSSYFSGRHPHTNLRLHTRPPMQVYAFPVTSTQHYGWAWRGRTTLEVYGSTSCNYRTLAAKRSAGE